MEVLHWNIDVIKVDQGWNARWQSEADMARWGMLCNIESEEDENNGRSAYIGLYVRIESETLDEVAAKLRKWFRPHFGPGWSFGHLSYIYGADLERAFEEKGVQEQHEFFAHIKKWSDNDAKEEEKRG